MNAQVTVGDAEYLVNEQLGMVSELDMKYQKSALKIWVKVLLN